MSDPVADMQQTARRGPGVIAVFTSHWLSMLGLGLVLTGIIAWACVIPAQLRSGKDNPYIGLAATAAGAVIVLGAFIAPAGLYLGRKRLVRRIAAGEEGGKWAWRRLFLFLAATTLVNLVIASQATLRAVHGLESKEFCGSCHVMTPESVAFDQGPHAGILCVDCHVGNGTVGFLKSKIQGTHQLMLVLTDKVEKPLKTAIESGLMVPSAQTCEECHWKNRPAAARVRLIQRYAEDEANTPESTLLTMNTGGSVMGGIHGAHNGEGVEISFVAADARRQDIQLVEYRNTKTGKNKTFVKAGVDAASLKDKPRITMQCFDCHNRPAHAFQMPDRAVDRAMMFGQMSASLPFLKKRAMEVLQAKYASSADAAAKIPSALAAAYQSESPEVAKSRAADIATAGTVIADIYAHNVFPEYGVTWGTYPDNQGHQTSPGCFRCHGGDHLTATGEKITNNCFRCHHPAAVEETSPEVLELLGVDKLLKNAQTK